MVDFFELIYGQPMQDLPPEATLASQQAQSVEILGKHYATGSWVRFGTVMSPLLVGGQIVSMYTVNNDLYFVIDGYTDVHIDGGGDGALWIALADKPTRQIVAAADFLYLNGMWSIGTTSDVRRFIEMGF